MYPTSYSRLCLSTEHTNGDGDYTSSLLGILVMQDVHLGLLVALLPALAGRTGVAQGKGSSGVVQGILNGLNSGDNTGNFFVYKRDNTETAYKFLWWISIFQVHLLKVAVNWPNM